MKFLKNRWVVLLGAMLLTLFVGFSGSSAMSDPLLNWYPQLKKPPLTPPDWLFAPVWTLLYILMAISLWWVWKTPSKQTKRNSYFFFYVQLFLNWIWSFLFFGLKSPALGLIDIIALLVVILLTIRSFYKISRLAAYLLMPYLLWVAFAAYLNGAIWFLNR